MNKRSIRQAADFIGFLTVPTSAVFFASMFFYTYIQPWLGGVVATGLSLGYLAIMLAIVRDRIKKGDYSLSAE